MADYRAISQEYAKEGIKAALVINGAAAISLLTQATKLIEQGLADEAARAMIAWAFGVALAASTWLIAFLSARYVDKGELEDNQQHTHFSNRLMQAGMVANLLSIVCFLAGCWLLASGFLDVHAATAVQPPTSVAPQP